MHPAPSVIAFSVWSGIGLGYLAFLGLGLVQPQGWQAFALWGVGYAFAVSGLVASTFHLGRPERAWRAFTQWRSSWLSREAIAAVAALLLLAPVALSDWLGLGLPRLLGVLGAVCALGTVLTTSMIYAQLKTVPRWNHWSTPVTFLGFSIAGGGMLAGQVWAPLALLALGPGLLVGWHFADRRFAERGHTMATATGLGGIGVPSVWERGHTAGNYLLHEMMYRVGRKHALRLRVIAVVCASLLPSGLLLLGSWALVPALALHLVGALAARWLFFAEAEHVVGLYYGR
jgi:sulfite dehydrogenase (quinone) subunit SoeC